LAKRKVQNKAGNVDSFSDGESWLNRTWRPAAAVIYLAICLFDFIIAPAFMGFKSVNIEQIAGSVHGLDPQIAIALIQNRTPWQPLTLQGSGLFHVAFGAILGVAAWTRGTAQIESIKQNGESERSPYTPTMVPQYFMPGMQPQAPQVPQVYQQPMYQQPPMATGAGQQTTVNVQAAPVVEPKAEGIDNPDAEPDQF
jgi:hypothetical protein